MAIVALLFLVAVAIAIVAAGFAKKYYNMYQAASRTVTRIIEEAEEYIKDETVKIRAQAIKGSTAVVKGRVAEQLVPFRPDFNYNPRDIRFLGSPIDLVVFDGLTEGELKQVAFVEVKTGNSRMSKRERQVRDAIHDGRVTFEVFRATPLLEEVQNVGT